MEVFTLTECDECYWNRVGCYLDRIPDVYGKCSQFGYVYPKQLILGEHKGVLCEDCINYILHRCAIEKIMDVSKISVCFSYEKAKGCLHEPIGEPGVEGHEQEQYSYADKSDTSQMS